MGKMELLALEYILPSRKVMLHANAVQQEVVIIKCHVRLGNTKDSSSNNKYTFAGLLLHGFDSVRLTDRQGYEFVVYSYDQVQILGSITGHKKECAIM